MANTKRIILGSESDDSLKLDLKELTDGTTAAPVSVTNADGDQITTFGDETYFVSDKDDDSSPNYYGFLDKDGNWYIMKEVVATGADTYRYIKGTSGYTTNWTNRTTLTYDYYNNIF